MGDTLLIWRIMEMMGSTATEDDAIQMIKELEAVGYSIELLYTLDDIPDNVWYDCLKRI